MVMDETAQRRRLLIILYLAFISLGLPDTVLGVAWPEMRLTFGAPLVWAGGLQSLTTIISVFSSLTAGWLMLRYRPGSIVVVSAIMTGTAMLGYGLAPGVAVVAGFTVLFGLGQGAVDSVVNTYMSRHYSSRQMNWVHGCWGLGAVGGPLIFTTVYGLDLSWRVGYLSLCAVQVTLSLIFLATLKWWLADNGRPAADALVEKSEFATVFSPRRAAAGVAFYFFYPGLEVVTGLWGASYLMEVLGASAGLAGAALTAYWASLTLGRFAVGLAAARFSNQSLMRAGLALVAAGLIPAALAEGPTLFCAALSLLGLGLSPMYPTMMHETPRRVGLERSGLIISFQVGAALAGAAVLPVLAGLIVRQAGLAVLPRLMMVMAVLLIAAHEISAGRRSA